MKQSRAQLKKSKLHSSHPFLTYQIVLKIRQWYRAYLDENIFNLKLENISKTTSNTTIFIFYN